ncbi:putative DMT superfamily transporter inner membrane protein [Escherichia coli]|uniref:Putative DMT superfamily transporter inner membrane protein n=1 Tax=Escherichia coli TaxID=562 RepID=A0A377BQG1_ECOLX|nr:putative DMT superfamily transporter inner membrane protein [Escherichia coli]
MRFRQLLPLFGALFALYIIWGSTYFVIRIGRGKLASVNDGGRSIPGSRYFIAGIFCYCADTNSPRYVRCSMPR